MMTRLMADAEMVSKFSEIISAIDECSYDTVFILEPTYGMILSSQDHVTDWE